ncbi:helix-turn-helix domain-containing protein [Flagellimonas allohymeniacidonis]|uniref:AraC family transcriptional regulator n=1 Tax=Flagellimonas allohymeniacidonis TaxID=2517819 RepID=A0A4Q8QL06_9FLAO|nr:helix-turn-helix domain-containing protein [Allomuricauda hymeniacidonis]TAI48926.1 AraC family transcriptional regulator [Allomuricauda hymeniacidonis]
MFLAFPEFDIYSTPLLLLSLQGLLFTVLLISRYFNGRNVSDFILALILLFTCFGQTCYTVGFMAWYDTFRTTKINYVLFNVSLALAPLIYLYVKSITTSHFRFRKRDWLHFLPLILFLVYRASIYFYDSGQSGFDEVQNGVLKLSLDEPYILPLITVFGFGQMLLYLAFTFQLFYNYRKKINAFFSNTYKLELNWIRNFLVLYAFLFLYDMIQTAIASYFTELNYMQRWWLNLFVGLTIIYVGIKGYFTDTTKLKKLNFSFTPNQITIPDVDLSRDRPIDKKSVENLERFMEMEKPYLNPELNLVDLAKQVNMSRAQLSEAINTGFGRNFNDFINMYRVQAFKKMIAAEKHQQLSLLGIAFECGFNSKATFNRVFKKLTHSSPSEFLKTAY